MFFITYLRRELRRRMRQAVFIALGLALGVGLVITVAAASSGFSKAQSDALSGLYGVGTEVTVTGAAPAPPTVIGIVSQPQEGGNPTDIYVPLARAQAISLQGGGAMRNEVNTIYVTAASAADISTVSKEISGLLPGATVTTASSLASDVTGSVASAEKLVNDLGRWLAALVLIAAFAVACLLTMAAVARRVREFGTLKAIGWRSRRIVAQVLGESAVMGVAGAAVGVGLGFAGAAIIAAVAPKLPATVGGTSGPRVIVPSGFHGQPQMLGGASLSHPVTVPVHPSVSAGVIIVAVILAMAGGLLAGAFGSWQIARLPPADALGRVA
jgi:putative ABC transport system permease protein